MMDALLSQTALPTFLWQSTAWLLAGLAASILFRRRPARGHAALVVSLLGLLATPIANVAVSTLGWGILRGTPVQSASAPLVEVTPTVNPHVVAVIRDVPVLVEQAPPAPVQKTAEVISPPSPPPHRISWSAWFNVANGLFAVWLLMSAGLAARLARASARARRLVAGKAPVTDAGLQHSLDDAAAEIGLRTTPVLGTADVRSPMIWCWGPRPTVLIPIDADENSSSLDWIGIFRHELAHWKRKDHLTGMLAQLMVVLLPWHPLAWWARRRLHELSEQACDEWAVADGRSPVDFAELLLSLHAERRHHPALAAVSSHKLLSVRVRRLMTVEFANPRLGRAWAAAFAGTTLIAAAALALAQAAPPKPTGDANEAAATAASKTAATEEVPPEKREQAQPPSNVADLADAEMHVISVYWAKSRTGVIEGGTVHVTVQRTTKPVVLVLTSYFAVRWRVTLAEGARIKQAIVSGYQAQEITGLPADVPIESRFGLAPDSRGWFWGHEWNTPQWREMVRRLNDATGLPVTSFQGKNDGDSFVVDGIRGRDLGQRELPPPPQTYKEPTAEELLAASSNADLHVLGMYMPSSDARGKPIEVDVRPTANPLVLVLTSFMDAVWRIKPAEGARINAVIVSAPNPQVVVGVPAGVPVRYFCPDPALSYFENQGSQSSRGSFYAYKWNTYDYRRLVEKLNDETGRLVSTFQGEYEGTSFVVDGTRGREFVQKERKPQATLPKEPTRQELLEICADAELHILGTYMQAGGDGAPVDVEIRPTAKPVVLVVSSYSSALWNFKLAKGARLKAVLISGGKGEQEYEGIPTDVPIVYRAGQSHTKDRFYAYKWNTLNYRRMVEAVNDMTGLLVSTFQSDYEGKSFVVDGTRGREFVQKERKPRPTLPKEPTPEELLAACADSELHAVSIYWAGPGDDGMPVDVEVRPTGKPIVLVVASYFSVLWNLKIAPGARVKAIIVGGYFEQEIEGLPPGVPVAYRANSPSRNPDYFFGYDNDSLREYYVKMLARLKEMTGLPVSTFQGQNAGRSFVVDGKRGREAAQTEQSAGKAQGSSRGTRAADEALKQPKQENDPAADVADIPSQDLKAGDDADKRYFLIGPKPDAKPPADGYGLVVILPGGDGSADFHPFVKRIYKHALSEQYLAAQPVAVKWAPNQQIVWPTKTNPVAKMKFSTEEFVAAVIEDAAKNHKVDRSRVFSLSWSSSGPAAYALSLEEKPSVTGSFIAMSVFNPKVLAPLKAAEGRAFYLYHSPDDRVCPHWMARKAERDLAENGATVRLETYAGGHGWRGDVYGNIRTGIEWLEKNAGTKQSPR